MNKRQENRSMNENKIRRHQFVVRKKFDLYGIESYELEIHPVRKYIN